jgi:UDP-glucose 4-epimerase
MSHSHHSYILVTGGAGFIGSHTVVQLVAAGFTPVIVDDFRNSAPFIIERMEQITGHKCIVHQGDCTNLEWMRGIVQTYKPYGVIHFAAYKAVGESVAEPLKYYHNNIGSLVALLEVCQEFEVNNIVFSSSCTVYGEPKQIPVTENTPQQPATSPYGYTKQVCEQLCTDYARANENAKIVLLRYFNPVGAHPSGLIGELPIGVPNNLVPYITQTVAGLRQQLTIFGDTYSTPDGTCIRDYIHVVDLADAHVLALQKIQHLGAGISLYNVGTGNGSSVMEVVKAFEQATNLPVNFKIGEKRSGDAAQIFADNSKIVKELGWTSKFTLQDAMLHAWNWQKGLKNS